MIMIELIISKKSIKNVYGNEKYIKLTLFNKIYTEREILDIHNQLMVLLG